MKFTTFIALISVASAGRLRVREEPPIDPAYDDANMPGDRTGTYSPKANMWTGYEG